MSQGDASQPGAREADSQAFVSSWVGQGGWLPARDGALIRGVESACWRPSPLTPQVLLEWCLSVPGSSSELETPILWTLVSR